MIEPPTALAVDPATGRRLWTKADHDSARADAWGAVLAGVPPFGDSEAELRWLDIAAEERERRNRDLPGRR